LRRKRIAGKLFFHNYLWLILYIGCLLGLQIKNIYRLFQSVKWQTPYTMQILMLQKDFVIYFLLTLFISYSLFYKAKADNLQETLLAMKRKTVPLQLDTAAFLFKLSLVSTTVNAVYCYICYFLQVGGDINTSWLWQIFVMCYGHLFLLMVVGILIGFAASLLQSRYLGYAVLLGVGYGTFYLGDEIVAASAEKNSVWYQIKDLFTFAPYNTDSVDPLTGFFTYPQQRVVLLFWVLLLGALFALCLHMGKRKKYIAAAVLIVCSVFALYDYWQYPVISFDMRVVLSQNGNMYHTSMPPKDETAQFGVTHYDMQLDLRHKVKNTCTVTVDTPDLDEYKFTLLYGHKVTSVTDQTGAKLQYTRDGDYLCVTRGEAEVQTLCIKYVGYSSESAATADYITMTSTYGVFPIPGYYPMVSYARFVERPFMFDAPVQFDIKVKSDLEVVCNLPSVGHNQFSGNDTAVVLLGGLLTQETQGDYTFVKLSEKELGFDNENVGIYSVTTWVEDIEAEYDALARRLGINTPALNLKDKLIVPTIQYNLVSFAQPKAIVSDKAVVFNGTYGGAQMAATHLLFANERYTHGLDLMIYTLKSEIIEACYLGKTPEAQQEAIDAFIDTYRNVDELIASARNFSLIASYRLNSYMVKMFEKYGVDTAIPMLYDYITDETDNRTAFEYFADLGYTEAIAAGEEYISKLIENSEISYQNGKELYSGEGVK